MQMGVHVGGLLAIVIVFLIGAWASQKYPQVNLIGKVTG